jgi:hypothetical protein
MAEIRAITLMALSWLDAAARTYLLDNKPSLLSCFDDVVGACVGAAARDLTPNLAIASGGRRRAGQAR